MTFFDSGVSYIGQAAALSTAFLWSLNTICFSLAGKRVGSGAVTHIRLWVAILGTCLLHFFLIGGFFPTAPTTHEVIFLGISGIAGYVIGDSMGFESLVRLGAHSAAVVMTSSPVFAVLLAWIFLGQKLHLIHILSIATILGGIVLVMSERQPTNGNGSPANGRWDLIGVLLALGGACGQATGLVLSKEGMSHGLPAVSANMLRLSFALPAILLIHLITRHARGHFQSMVQDRGAATLILIGAILGPVAGVNLLLFSMGLIPVGIASALSQMSPIFLLFITPFYTKEKHGMKAVFGTFLAVGGATVLFLA